MQTVKIHDESRAKLIMSIHKLFGAPLSEAKNAYDLIIEYFRLKSNMGDHPEKCKPREYVLVEKKISNDFIDRQTVLSKIKEVCFSKEWWKFRVNYGSNGQRDFLINYIEQMPPVTPQKPSNDMVSLGVFEQVMWERDVAIEQLKELGYGFGEKPRTGHWIDGFGGCECSECGGLEAGYSDYCPNCGAKMESEGEG